MDLFGQNILDFPSDFGSFLFGNFPTVCESPFLLDPDIESLHDQRELGSSTDLDSLLNSDVTGAPAAEEWQERDMKPPEKLSFEDMMTEGDSSPFQETETIFDNQELPDCKNMLEVFSQLDEVHHNNSDTSSQSCLEKAEDLEKVKVESIKIERNLPSQISQSGDQGQYESSPEEMEAVDEFDSSISAFDDLLKSMFEVAEGTDQKTDDLLTSILSNEDIIDTEYFENFDIDLVDPACIEEDEKGKLEKEAASEDSGGDFWPPWVRDHDYTSTPHMSSLYLTPPHSPGKHSEVKASLKLVKKNKFKTLNHKNKTVKFSPTKDYKFVINLPVQKEITVNPRSILKRTYQDDRGNDGQQLLSPPKLGFAMEVLDHQSLLKTGIPIEENRESVKSKKKRSSSKSCRKIDSDRELHNSMERKRRIQMNEEYESLKSVIPTIAHLDKISKLQILINAKDYCHGLEGKLERLGSIHYEEEKRRIELLKRINILKLKIL